MLEDAEKQSKISELYDVCMKAEANAVVLPNIVDRLDSLQTLHQQGNKTIRYLFSFKIRASTKGGDLAFVLIRTF